MARPNTPKNDKEELLYYKGIYQIRQFVDSRLELMAAVGRIDKEIARVVVSLKSFVTWGELGEMLGMSEAQAKTYLSPLMGNIEEGR